MYAVIDLGSNSFHLLIADCKNREISIIDRYSKKIQLAEGLATSGRLSSAAMERGIACLQEFLNLLQQHPVEKLRVVATQAVRQASNSEQFIRQVKALGLEVEVISGPREAELIYYGITATLPPTDDNRLIIDIGGASTEIAIGNRHRVAVTESLAMGCVAWRDKFFSNGMRFSESLARARAAARAIIEPVRNELIKHGWAEVYASSGSAKMLRAIAQANNWSAEVISADALHRIESAIADCDHHTAIQLAGLKTDRQDLLAPGLSIMMALMDSLGFDELKYSKTALREGVLQELIRLDSAETGAKERSAK